MSVILNTENRRIFSMKAIHYTPAENKNTTIHHTSNQDQVTISQEGRDSLKLLGDKDENQLSTMTKEDVINMFKQWKNENQPKLEVDPYWIVDPDSSIARKTYFESYLGQLNDMEDTIKSYYTSAYEEAVSAPINSLAFISGKYLCDWSDYYASNLSAKERQWTYHQLRAMLTGSNVALNDPYALSSHGGAKTVDEMDKIAKQAVKNKLDSLIKDRESSINH